MATWATLWAVAVLIGTAGMAIVVHRRPVATTLVYAICLVASLFVAALAIRGLVYNLPPATFTLPIGLPWIGAHFRVDALSLFFQAVVNLGAAVASLYALGYGRHEERPGRVLPFYPMFLAGMNIVLMADDAFSFLVGWEFMSLSSWALVLAHHHDPENRRAGYVYILMASFGTFALLLSFGLLAGPLGGYAFGDMRLTEHADWLKGLVLALALVGAGSKAGLVPLHVWLPLAHPAAPSHVSALMSGVMTKVAIYGFIRIVFDLLGTPQWWWSLVVLLIASVTAVLGVLYALMQRDLKRLLAYSTIENVGIIFIGLGLALAFKANGMTGAAALAFTAALFHVFNHSLFKGLLFFGAGAVLTATGERDIEKLGGLIQRMPQTAFVFLGGCLAISALPPLNGFVSEWLMFQAVLLSPDLPQWGLKFAVPAAGAMLALAAALSATCFVRAFGIAFLGRPRTPAAAEARETDVTSRAAMFVLLALCLFAGVLPGLLVDAIAPVAARLVGAGMPPQTTIAGWSIVPIAESRSSYNGLLIFLFITVSTLATIQVIHRFASDSLRRAPIWDCGFPNADPATQYTAESFAQPVRRVFGESVLLAHDTVDMPAPGDPRPARLTVTVRDPIWEAGYAPLSSVVAAIAERLNHLQFLSIRRYLSLVFAALITLLLVVAIWA
jgi:hydrogenase-4 component B